MDSVSGYAGTHQPRSGGKIVRPRRSSVVRTPYHRPASRSLVLPQQNPSWISRLVYKPATVIASGAGKFISSIVFSESSSSSSEDEDSCSDIDGDEDIENYITEFTEDETMVEDLMDAQQSTIQRLSSKRVIEQLLMQETFAREEGDKLINIIKARVIDHPTTPTADEGRHSDYVMKSEVNVGEPSNKAVMEAKRWLEEKKSTSNSKYIAMEDGAGSPVDVAKSYMRARLPWGSPAVNNSKFRSSSPSGTPFPYCAGNLSSSKLKMKSRVNQSWNIQDEIRKVRAKATEEMLKSVSPSSVASLEPKHIPYVLDASLNLEGDVQAVQNEQSGVQPNLTIPTSEPVFDGGTGVDDSNVQDGDFIQPSSTIGDATNAVLALGATSKPPGNVCIPKDVFETSKEADEIGAARPTSNGSLSSSPSSPVAMEGQPKTKPPNETEASQPIAETPGDNTTLRNGSDGAIDNEHNYSDSSASRNSSSTHEEEWLPGNQSLPNSNSASSSPGTTKVVAYTRRGRSRGRGRGRGGRGRGRAK